MKRVCCSALFRALIKHRDGLEWTSVSEGDAAGPVVVGQFVGGWFLPLLWCPYCDAEI
uniref:Uncharacterized protein n=1 Tax=viral metagenome TaxID=1070528 RepID=A0A6H1Z8L2_9ZZZZ